MLRGMVGERCTDAAMAACKERRSKMGESVAGAEEAGRMDLLGDAVATGEAQGD